LGSNIGILKESKPFKNRCFNKIMSQIVYLITVSETEGSIGFYPNFQPEILTDKEKAEARFKYLQDTRSKYSGIFYIIEPVKMDKINEDY